MVSLNMLLLGLEVDTSCFDCPPQDRPLWTFIDVIFTLAFFAELVVRLGSDGVDVYFYGTHEPQINTFNALVNTMDVVLVLLRGTWMFGFAGVTQLPKVLSALRVAHVGRFIRQMKLGSKFRELWIFMEGIGNVAQTVLWVSVLLTLLVYVGAVMMTILVGKSDEVYAYTMGPWSKQDYWGSVPQSMLSLFQVLTWDHWFSRLTRPIVLKHPAFMLIFVPFLCVGTLGLMNIIIAVIIEGVLSSAQASAEREAKEKHALDRVIMESLKAIFEEADRDGSGSLDWDELQEAVQHRSVTERLDLLGIGHHDLNLLFGLLDENQVGQISTGRFFRGCLRLRGVAMATDLNRLTMDTVRSINRAGNLVNQVDIANSLLVSVIRGFEEGDVHVVKSEADSFDEVFKAKQNRGALLKKGKAKLDVRQDSVLLRLGLDDPDLNIYQDGRTSQTKNKSLVHAALRTSALALEDMQVRRKPPTPQDLVPVGDKGAGIGRQKTSQLGAMKRKERGQDPLGERPVGRLSLLLT
mmetsp:Transcript_44914/g.103901  ORF Transcript_44914/g.103901 Transcript_44914/m.103901 type:complete len:522 (+) Transcript_44914:2-1567(+)